MGVWAENKKYNKYIGKRTLIMECWFIATYRQMHKKEVKEMSKSFNIETSYNVESSDQFRNPKNYVLRRLS